jgi:hypothetical protein
MPKITDFRCENEQGTEIMADPHGDNVALICAISDKYWA